MSTCVRHQLHPSLALTVRCRLAKTQTPSTLPVVGKRAVRHTRWAPLGHPAAGACAEQTRPAMLLWRGVRHWKSSVQQYVFFPTVTCKDVLARRVVGVRRVQMQRLLQYRDDAPDRSRSPCGEPCALGDVECPSSASDNAKPQREDPADFLQTADFLGQGSDAPKLPDAVPAVESSEVNSSVPVPLEETSGDEDTPREPSQQTANMATQVQLQMPRRCSSDCVTTISPCDV
jgi:hypothetical protein